MMEAELIPKPKRKYMKASLIAVCIPVLFTLTAFAYSMFSGIDGDELNINAEYHGDGIVQVNVENLSSKDLRFNETVKLEQWSTSEEIFEITQEMPTIKPNKRATITIDVPDEYLDRLETPIADTDWYYFVLTTNNFAFGQSWMASLTFAEPIITEKSEEITRPEIPVEDNTNQANVDTVKNNFEIQHPLSQLEISFNYNDYEDNGEYAHAELDLAAELGTEIYPLSSGTVVCADFNAEMGRYMVIDHGNGLVSKYTHCAELLKEKGDVVVMDDVIATVGKTGMATGSHLGFSVTLNEVPINPEKLFL